MHAGQLPVSAAVARSLIAAQFPRWQDLPVSRVASPGTVNAIFRVGGRLAARFPFAGDLAEFIADVRAIGTRGRAFSGRGRGGSLRDHDEWMSTCFTRSERLLDVPPLRRLWAGFRELPRESPDVMSHGDLTPGNVLVAGGRLTGVLDTGSFGPADPALDLISAWNLLEAGPREALRDALRCAGLDWERGRAWAFQQAMGLVWYYASSNPVMSRLGRVTLDRILGIAGSWQPLACLSVISGNP